MRFFACSLALLLAACSEPECPIPAPQPVAAPVQVELPPPKREPLDDAAVFLAYEDTVHTVAVGATEALWTRVMVGDVTRKSRFPVAHRLVHAGEVVYQSSGQVYATPTPVSGRELAWESTRSWASFARIDGADQDVLLVRERGDKCRLFAKQRGQLVEVAFIDVRSCGEITADETESIGTISLAGGDWTVSKSLGDLSVAVPFQLAPLAPRATWNGALSMAGERDETTGLYRLDMQWDPGYYFGTEDSTEVRLHAEVDRSGRRVAISPKTSVDVQALYADVKIEPYATSDFRGDLGWRGQTSDFSDIWIRQGTSLLRNKPQSITIDDAWVKVRLDQQEGFIRLDHLERITMYAQ